MSTSLVTGSTSDFDVAGDGSNQPQVFLGVSIGSVGVDENVWVGGRSRIEVLGTLGPPELGARYRISDLIIPVQAQMLAPQSHAQGLGERVGSGGHIGPDVDDRRCDLAVELPATPVDVGAADDGHFVVSCTADLGLTGEPRTISGEGCQKPKRIMRLPRASMRFEVFLNAATRTTNIASCKRSCGSLTAANARSSDYGPADIEGARCTRRWVGDTAERTFREAGERPVLSPQCRCRSRAAPSPNVEWWLASASFHRRRAACDPRAAEPPTG